MFLKRESGQGKPSGDGESITDWLELLELDQSFRCQPHLELGWSLEQLDRSLGESLEQLDQSLEVSFRLESWWSVRGQRETPERQQELDPSQESQLARNRRAGPTTTVRGTSSWQSSSIKPAFTLSSQTTRAVPTNSCQLVRDACSQLWSFEQ